ncbi:oxygenase MpaB family protein [Caulobacter sp. SL161]|uniref:oxygenase MpaB family protein n=1 Tax=Caulobacter sp. SL161 TaxID=2995156 RepID=UPI0022758F68|nr:oxygenase MpaB family protein [Caulobacter sp. SL161]MCY1648570.1 oxygenase MpaB family protein [Caulobacter sp. SL161]
MARPSTYLGWKIDYAHPLGEPALLDPGSMHWRVYKNPIALAVGGVTAVLLEFAEPRIRSGVWDHSTFKSDPLGRAMRTGTAALIGVYGPASAARRVIQSVTHMHARVSGETPGGETYRALDPDLLNWVAATAVYGFVTAYDRFVEPLSQDEKSRFYEEAAPVTHLYGATVSPGSEAEFMAMLQALRPRFEPHPIIDEFLQTIGSGKAAPAVPKPLHRALARAAVSLLPPPVRRTLALGREHDLRLAEGLALKTGGRLAERIAIRSSPPCQASIRLGLPHDFLYRGEAERQRLLADLRAGVTAGGK